MKVMIVDDEKDVMSLFNQKFRKERRAGKIDFHFAFSGEEAIKYLQQETNIEITLILSDINMPGMNGLQLLKRIKETFSHIKVFMITAYSDPENYETAIKLGADDYISKPIDFDKLKEKILSLSSEKS